MAVTAGAYGPAVLSLFNAEIDTSSPGAGTWRGMLLDNTHTLDQDAHRYVSSVIADEIAGTGYTARGLALTGLALAYDSGTNIATLDCDDLLWNATTLTNVRYLITYLDLGAGNEATSPLLSWMNFGADQSTVGQPFLVTIPATGLVSVTVS